MNPQEKVPEIVYAEKNSEGNKSVAEIDFGII